ncbi:MAG: TetR/AcrR family transcriptional regulator [Deltaproteobacteria bacterium]|nr:TetR/AcrR family transcriptional regulator [Deltaproteobacteria bacterium]MBT8483435.1 TetR/AcrR family transcriptional regulator [Deltaproteobacteria bacterium]NNK43622.1 TetR/AcrR family transcriptional regulator [Myxococcales bacterium]NNL26292.1 TetR/AcrR family transcriptional regulator [Myxococcales bacterium]
MIKLHCPMATAKKAYHHGELRESLLEAAELLLEEDGPVGLSLRKVGRRLGVTPGAPYRHFEDKDALLAALAVRGFQSLRERMMADLKGSADGEESLRRAGLGYLEFASQHPEMFRLMFGWIPSRDVPELCEAGDAAYAGLRGILERCEQEGLLTKSVPDAGLMAWSAVHGAAFLLIDKRLMLGDEDPCPAGVLELLHESIWTGIGKRGHAPPPEPL